jgi:CRISPR-associated protein Cas1
MRKLLNTLFVTTQGAYLHKDGETIAVTVEQETRLRLPVHTIESLVCFGQVSCSPFVLGLCAERGVGVSFFTENGRFLARVQGPVRGNVLLRRAQYRAADDPERSAAAARWMVAAKVANSRGILLRALREKAAPDGAARAAVEAHARILDQLLRPLDLDRVRGLEGEAAQHYFSAFDELITANRDAFQFTARSRRPPLDPVNALLSFLYTLLVHDAASACEMVGLDPAVGFLHRDRPGRPSLALDLMEEFRAAFADRLALALINRKQVAPKGFTKLESGGVIMDDATRKTVLMAYQERKREEIQHPFLGESVPIGLLPYVQALLLARWLRGDLDGYPAFVWR